MSKKTELARKTVAKISSSSQEELEKLVRERMGNDMAVFCREFTIAGLDRQTSAEGKYLFVMGLMALGYFVRDAEAQIISEVPPSGGMMN